MTVSKHRISSPLEAGTSILDAHNLPPHLSDALEYTSKRLARKALHVTLVVLRRDYQLPTIITACQSPTVSPPSLPSPTTPPAAAPSPRFGFASSSFASLRHRLRHGPHPVLATAPLASPTYLDSIRSDAASPTFSVAASDTSSSRAKWPQTPATPLSPPPMTPCTSTTATDASCPLGPPHSFGIRLIYANTLDAKSEKTLRQTIDKAEKKFGIGTDWLPPASPPSAHGLTPSIVKRSLLQNEILFSSEGLTLLSLDRLFSFKCALSSYSRTGSSFRLEDAVDELRRLFLANGGRKVSRSDILRSYDWLSVSDTALVDVDRMYRRAYGGFNGIGAIEGMKSQSMRVEIEEAVEEEASKITHDQGEGEGATDGEGDLIAKAMASFKFATPPASTKGPLLKLQTNFELPVRIQDDDGSEDEDEELTARPTEKPPLLSPWNSVSIDEVLHERRSIRELGPMTPNGYDDISPITRGEWGFLFSGDSWSNGRTVAVETW